MRTKVVRDPGRAEAVAFMREIDGNPTSVPATTLARYRRRYWRLAEREQFDFLHAVAEQLTLRLDETNHPPVDYAARLMSDWFLRPF